MSNQIWSRPTNKQPISKNEIHTSIINYQQHTKQTAFSSLERPFSQKHIDILCHTCCHVWSAPHGLCKYSRHRAHELHTAARCRACGQGVQGHLPRRCQQAGCRRGPGGGVAPILLHPSSRAGKCAQSPWWLCHIHTDSKEELWQWNGLKHGWMQWACLSHHPDSRDLSRSHFLLPKM